MNLQFSEAYEAFRREVQTFLSQHWHGYDGSSWAERRRTEVTFRKLAIEQGYLARGIPRSLGGSEQPPDLLRAVIIQQELDRAGAPGDVGAPVSQLIPTLLEHGTDFQKETYLPGTVTGEIHWCQGYSEPGSGSDLASLQTRAALDGDEWVINGQKIWTSRAQHAEMMYLLVRTEPDANKHAGISYLLLDMSTPGIEVSPLMTASGADEFTQVFFNDVRTPANHLVGKRGAGWLVSRSTLDHERGTSSVGSSCAGRKEFEQLLVIARETRIDGRPATEHPAIRQALADVDASLLAQETSSWLQLTCSAHAEDPGPIGLMNKQIANEVNHKIARLTLDLIGDDALRAPAEGARHLNSVGMGHYIGSLGYAIAAGTSNIQRNVIAERGYGLPRDFAITKKA